MIDKKVDECNSVEVQQVGRVARGQNLAQRVGQRVAKAVVTRVCNTKIGNKKKLQIDLVKGACKMRVFMPVCNTIGVRPKWSSFMSDFLLLFKCVNKISCLC